MDQYEADIRKATEAAEHMRKGAPDNVLWLIVQSLRYVGGLALGANLKLDALLHHQSACDLSGIEERLDRIEAAIEAIPTTSGKPGARIVVTGPVSDR